MNSNELNSNVRLEDDLYNYVNGEWIAKAKIPADQSSTGGFIDLRNGVEKTLLKDFKKMLTKPSKDELLNRAVTLFGKVLDEKSRLTGLNYLLDKVNYLDSIKDEANFATALYYLYSNNYPLPFNIGVTEDMKDATKYSLILAGPSTILPDTTMYNSPNAAPLLNVYKDMVLTILAKLGISNANELIDKTLQFDMKISKIVKSSEEWADYIKCYNPYDFNKVCELLTPAFANLVVSCYGKAPEKVIIFDPKFLDNYHELMADFSDYLAWAKVNLIVSNVSYLSEEYRNLAGTYARAISGAKKMSSVDKFAYRLVNQYYDEVIGVYYGKKYFGEEAKADVISIVKNLVESYKIRLQENTWLSKATIDKAITKLDKMEIKIGYPDKIADKYYSYVYSPNQSLLEIIDHLTSIVVSYSDAKLYQPVDRTLWVMSGNTVNACYNPSFNDITFPAAILQAPFYSINQSIEENYGGIGCVIGHEISHAFDNNGAQMDELGNINNWWTEADYKNFQDKTQAMIEQFDGLPLEGAKVNGKLSVSENIADNGGVTSSLASIERIKPNCDLKPFFINYARIWCTKARPEYTKLLLTVDVHGPAYYRANMQVRNFPEFYKAFNIKETDKMYLDPAKRIIIW